MEQLTSLPVTHLSTPLYLIIILLDIYLISKIRKKVAESYEAKDASVNILTSVGAIFERVLTGTLYGAFLMLFWDFRLFEIEFSWLALAICFVVTDISYYWKHRLEHMMRLGWASHVIHHSSQHFNHTTALRQTWTFLFTGLIVMYVPLVILGFHPVMIAFCSGLNLVYQFFLHTEAVRKLPKWIEAIMNTPSHHRVHHGRNSKDIDVNFAGTFIIWDKLVGTFVEEDERDPVKYGLVTNVGTFNILRLQFHEWIKMFRDVFQPGVSLKHRLFYIFKRPGWSHKESEKILATHSTPNLAPSNDG